MNVEVSSSTLINRQSHAGHPDKSKREFDEKSATAHTDPDVKP